MQINWSVGFGIVQTDFPQLLIFQWIKSQQTKIFSSTRKGFYSPSGSPPTITIKN
jgi:hypothetical protein